MPYDNEQRESESRKLEALTAISVAVGALGQSLIAVVRHNLEQGRRLESMDRKLDRLLELADAPTDVA